MSTVDVPMRVAVLPAGELGRRRRLLAALERAVPVRFVDGADPDALHGAAAVVCLGAEPPPGLHVPSLRALADERPGTATAEVAIGDDPVLPSVLRRARLHERTAHAPPVLPHGRVLATLGGAPAWVTAGTADVVSLAPTELAPGEPLRDRLGPGRSLALLALLAFLRRVAAPLEWRDPPLRAAFVVDDPNLHWRSYGHVDYRRVADDARSAGYHLAVAMVPLDGWLVHPATAARFRRERAQLSVVVHGNDHEGAELGRISSLPAAIGVAAQALRRIERFERRSGVPVARVMVPPHERLTAEAAAGLLACGFEGASLTRPYPWVATPERHWLAAPPEAGVLAGWEPADIVAGGLPILLRSDFAHPREDLVLKAFLGQPLILYGHHEDLRGGLELLGRAAADINRLGDVRWGPLDEIARGSVRTRIRGEVLDVRPLARHVRVEVPDGIATLTVDTSALGCAETAALSWRSSGSTAWTPGTPRDVRAGALEIRLQAPPPTVAAAAVRPRLRPLARRLASEARDRVRALPLAG